MFQGLGLADPWCVILLCCIVFVGWVCLGVFFFWVDACLWVVIPYDGSEENGYAAWRVVELGG